VNILIHLFSVPWDSII